MDLKTLFAKQYELDTYIEQEKGVKAADLLEEKLLALLVETGELANEVRSFKFWSDKERSSDEVILEEYVDGLHFLLSIGNLLEQEPAEEVPVIEEAAAAKEAVTSAFLEISGYISLVRMEPGTETYQTLFEAYVDLAGMLGYEWADVLDAYNKKNAENYDRQQRGY
ncbi:dUTP diphosphatase [Alkalicoccus chagannorensis]|uniref:dUTP diphosphatase n=1 Tax=Alkalicoccus chagannorensis TaxID=427072 RepID=UPI00042864A9|nr:dUTP diphosphatase [Alkalicoccus chagannorensis]